MPSIEEIPIRTEEDIVKVRQTTRRRAAAIGFNLVEQTKIVTAASEISRNALIYGGGGALHLEVSEQSGRTGLRLQFTDKGPGIPDIEAAMRDNFTTGGGLGLGLGGAKRLVHDFEIESSEKGTRVTLTHWKR